MVGGWRVGVVLKYAWSAEVLYGFGFEIVKGDLSILIGVEDLAVLFDVVVVGFVGWVLSKVRILRY